MFDMRSLMERVVAKHVRMYTDIIHLSVIMHCISYLLFML